MVASRQTRLKMRRGYVKAPLSYTVLMITQFTEKDEKEIMKGLVKATTPEKAKVLLPVPGRKSNWSMKPLMLVGDHNIHLLSFKGAEVSLFFQRKTSVITPEPEDPAPEGVIEHADDVWIRLDLFNKSPRQLVGAVLEDLEEKDREIKRLEIMVDALQASISANEHTMKSLRGQLEATQKKSKTKKGK